ncbi:MAG: RidA family protein [Cyclobacteriaceae bacterium]
MIKKEVITGEGIPKSHLPFSPGVIAGDFVFISGQASVDENGKIVNESFAGECRRSFENVRKILTAAGLDFPDVVQVRNYVGKQEDLAEFNQIYREYFSAPFPARTTLIGCLGELLKFEVDVIAIKRKT